MGVGKFLPEEEIVTMKKISDFDNLDDSGFFENSVCDKLNNSSDNFVIVEDDAFDVIESSVEKLLEEESSKTKTKIESSSPEPARRKRGRPPKAKPNSSKKDSDGNNRSPEPERNDNTQSEEAFNNSINDDDELLLVEDESPVKKVKTNNSKSSKSRSKPSLPAYEDLTPYEKIRADNIREREEMLLTLGIKEAFAEYKNEVGLGIKQDRVKKQTAGQAERRKSSRLEGKDIADYIHEDMDETDKDPSDHTHDGLRKHPCKECTNCLMKDCRKCIFCKDKRKYGGPNIKKQKCEFKEKCSQPIIICFICQGKRVFSCLACGKQFHETFQLEEHNREVHEAKQSRRRSARLSDKPNISR